MASRYELGSKWWTHYGYLTEWDDGDNIGSANTAFTKDYLNETLWNMPVNNIATVRHQKVCVTLF